MHDVAAPPLTAVQYVFVAVALNGELHVRGVRRCHLGFGHGVGRANLTGQQGPQVHVLLLGRSELGQHLHVASIRCRTVEDFERPREPTHDLGQRGELEVGQSGAPLAVLGRQEPVPNTGCLGLHLELLDDRRLHPQVVLVHHELVVLTFPWIDVLVHEGREHLDVLVHLGAVIEIHLRSFRSLVTASSHGFRSRFETPRSRSASHSDLIAALLLGFIQG